VSASIVTVKPTTTTSARARLLPQDPPDPRVRETHRSEEACANRSRRGLVTRLSTIGDQESLDEWSSIILLTLTRTRTHGVSVLTSSAVRGKDMGTGKGVG